MLTELVETDVILAQWLAMITTYVQTVDPNVLI